MKSEKIDEVVATLISAFRLSKRFDFGGYNQNSLIAFRGGENCERHTLSL